MRTSRGTIIDQALQRVGNTTSTLKAQARIRLNRILQELQQGWDWPYLWTSAPITIPPNGIIILPPNFLKAEDDQSLQVNTAAGNVHIAILIEVDHRTFALYSARSATTVATAPRYWTIDYGTLSGRAWPLPYDTCQATLRCKLLPPDFPIDTTNTSLYDADVPLFPWDTLLIDLLFEWAMSYEVDPRRGEQMAVNVDTVNRARGGSFPDKSYPAYVQLDPAIFSTPWRGN